MMADENRRKGAREFKNLPASRKSISLRNALDAGGNKAVTAVGEMLGGRRFSEVDELNELWQRASKNETRSYDASQREFRRLIANDDSKAAKSVREAFGLANINIEKKGLRGYRFRMDSTPYKRPKKLLDRLNKAFKGLKGKKGAVAAGVAVAMALMGSGSASASTPAPSPMPSANAEYPESIKENLERQVRVATELAGASELAGTTLVTGATLGFAAGAIGQLRAVKQADYYNLKEFGGSLKMVENAPYMIDPATGVVYAINIDPSALDKGSLSATNELQSSWGGGFFYDDKNVIYKDDNGKYYLGHW
jgi:hypothetical protein